MKILFIGFILVALLTGCGKRPTTGPTTATVPTYTPPQPTVHLRASNMGNISHIDFQVILPTGTTKNLLDYNGQADLRGTMQSSVFPCIKSTQHFNCKAQLSLGNINVHNCSVGGHPIAMLIVLLRGQQTQESYSISSINSEASWSCFYPKNTY